MGGSFQHQSAICSGCAYFFLLMKILGGVVGIAPIFGRLLFLRNYPLRMLVNKCLVVMVFVSLGLPPLYSVLFLNDVVKNAMWNISVDTFPPFFSSSFLFLFISPFLGIQWTSSWISQLLIKTLSENLKVERRLGVRSRRSSKKGGFAVLLVRVKGHYLVNF